MKKPLLYLMITWFTIPFINADVIYSPYDDFNLAGSIEIIGSKEFSFSKFNTLNCWGGIGVVSRSFESFGPSLGVELALETRQYLKANSYKGLNLGLYMGCAYMSHYSISHSKIYHDGNSIGLVPGLKITYKIIHNISWLISEPYIGISNVFTHGIHSKSANTDTFDNLGLILTIGYRIGFNKVD